MKRSLLSVCLFALVVLALSQCNPTEKPATDTSTTTAAAQSMTVPSEIAGPVMFRPTASDVIYVPDFTVTLKGGEPRTAKSDLTGRYLFSDVKPGKYTVCWEAPGWQNGCSPEVEIKEGESASPPADLKPAKPDSVVWGTVRLADGSAASAIDRSSATVEVPALEVAGAGIAAAQFRTNAAGQYAIGVAAPAANVRAAAGSARQELRMLPGAAGKASDITLPNHRPVISSLEITSADPAAKTVKPGDTLKLQAHTTDADGDTLQYKWDATAGTVTPGDGGTATWKLPDFEAQLSAYVFVMDGKGGSARQSTAVKVGLSNLPIKLPGGPPQCSPLSLASVPPPSGYPPTPPFLTRMGTTDYSAAYYKNVDPQSLRTTLGAWWKAAGFNPNDGSGGNAKAAYLNFNDLGFGRDMHFNQVNNNVYAWVTNYGCPDNNPNNANLAANPVPANAVATVCMEYAPIEGQTQQIVKFFVYVGGLPAGTLQGKADLDEWGPKPIPNLCQVCHGTNSQYTGGTNVNLGSSFIPFDLALLRYPGPSPTPPPADLAAYYKMNQLVKITNPKPAISALIDGWYTPLNNPPTQNNNYIPTGWKAGGSVPASAAGLYQNVVVPGCRTCHYSFSSSLSWDTYSSFLTYRGYGLIQTDVCAKGPVMPHAAVTYINFWTNPYPFPQAPPQYLGAYSDANWASFGGCTGK